LIVLFTALASGCAGETGSAARWDGSVRDSAGIEVVENFGKPLWRPGEEWKLVPDLRIGAVDGPPEYQFGRISGFVELSDGRLAIADGMAAKVRFFSPEGEHLYSVGKEGSGPMEFGQGWLALLRGHGDTILVSDPRNQQVHRLSPEGEWQSGFSNRPEGGWRLADWDTSPSGLIISRFTPLQLPDTEPVDTMDVVRVRNLDGTLGDALGRVPTSRNFEYVDGKPQIRRFAGRADFDLRWDDRGLITGRSDSYELTWYDRDGVPERIVRLHREPDPFTEAEQSTLMARYEALMKEGNTPPERIQQIKDALVFEPYYPYYRRFMNGPRGTLWLRRVKRICDMTAEEIAALTNSPTVRPAPGYDVFDGQGRYLGIVEAPEEMPLGLLTGDRLFGIVKDELDVEYLQIYRIEGLERAAGSARGG
jgi:hypothetical protein